MGLTHDTLEQMVIPQYFDRRKPMGQTATAKTAQEADQEIELICTIIRNGYHLGLNNHNRLSPRERFQFAVKLEEICTIAEWMSRYVEAR